MTTEPHYWMRGAHYDAGRDRLIIRLTTGVEVGFAPHDLEGLQDAEAFGLGIHFPTIDADLYVPALLEGVLVSKRWMAAQLGAVGGRTRSDAKAAASRENGKRGGRPAKVVAVEENNQANYSARVPSKPAATAAASRSAAPTG
nr:hypothetical protein [uncultured Rhodopila sp.]